jgi:acyl carrier protein
LWAWIKELSIGGFVVESVIKAYISSELVNKPELLPLKNDTPLLESGILDSLALLKFLVFLEKEFGVLVDDFDLIPENFNTIDTICAYVRSQQELHVQ